MCCPFLNLGEVVFQVVDVVRHEEIDGAGVEWHDRTGSPQLLVRYVADDSSEMEIVQSPEINQLTLIASVDRILISHFFVTRF